MASRWTNSLLAASGLVAALLTGCQAGPSEAGATPTSALTSAPTPSETLRPPPASAFATTCEQVLPLVDIQSLLGPDVVPLPFLGAGAHHPWLMRTTAAVQDGALVCRWGTPDSPAGTLSLFALAGGGDAYERVIATLTTYPYDYVAADQFDGVLTSCRDAYAPDGNACHWYVRAGDVWLSVEFRHLPASEVVIPEERETPDGLLPITAIIEGSRSFDLIGTAVDALLTADRREVPQVESSVNCAALTTDEVAAAMSLPSQDVRGREVVGVEEAVGSSTGADGGALWALSYERLGFSSCVYSTSTYAHVTALTAPGAAWVFDHPSISSPPIRPVGDLGDGYLSCGFDEGGTYCTASIARGEDVYLVEIGPHEATEELAVALLRALLP